MSKYVIDETTLVALANEVRTLVDSTDKLTTDEITAYTKTANEEINTQEALIQQIIEALRGKAVSGGTEDLNTVLTEQEELIAELKEVLNGKASGGGGDDGVNLENCTVNINPPSTSNYYICRETVTSDGAVEYHITRSYTGNSISLTTRCDSVMYIQASTIKGVEIDNGDTPLALSSGYGIVYKTPKTKGTVSIILKS